VSRPERELRIVVLGASNGAEAYTIASTLLAHPDPAVRFSIHAYDIDAEMIEEARRARYTREAVHDNPRLDERFLSSTFERDGDFYVVRPEVARHVRVAHADVFDPALAAHVGRADIVFVQNVLYHFKPREAARAFRNIVGLLAERAVLFVDGMDLALRTKLTAACGLSPLDYRIEEIHEDAHRVRGSSYPYVYFGLEPLRRDTPDWKRRYATIFVKGM
jgi:chemotaxis methyl-accepting protein methylase